MRYNIKNWGTVDRRVLISVRVTILVVYNGDTRPKLLEQFMGVCFSQVWLSWVENRLVKLNGVGWS
jgi:hypothetical protein